MREISLKFASSAALAFFLGAAALLLGLRGLSAQAVEIPAFPGAEGWGAQSVGGRGGKVIEVTNLNNAGTGSLRACIEDTSPRTCVFRTDGTIELLDSLRIEDPFITIAGQTAPGGGIVLKNDPSNRSSALVVRASDVIIRYIRSRPGPGPFVAGTAVGQGESDLDGIAVEGGATDVIIDHSSVSWAVDENVQIAQSEDVTIQWSITSEALHDSGHSDGIPHSMGLIVIVSDRTSIHHNLFAHNNWRNPRLKSSADVINNVIYNTGGLPDNWGGGSTSPISVNAIGNIWVDGPSIVHGRPYAFNFGGAGLYLEGNILPERATDDLPEEFAAVPDQRNLVVSTKLESPDVTATSALEAHDQVLADAGASARLDCQGNFISNYDAIDQRIINDVINGTGQIIDHPDDVGGWVSLSSGTPCVDDDHDGMADDWENIYFGSLTQGSSSDSSSDFDGDGYTDLEEYLNGTAPTEVELTPQPTASPTAGPPPTATASPTPGPSPTTTPSPTPGPPPTTTPSPTPGPPPTPTPPERPTRTPTVSRPPVPGEVSILVEAESASLTGAAVVETDSDASGGAYVTSSTGERSEIRHQVTIPSTGTYYVWARVYRTDPGAAPLFIGVGSARDEIHASLVGAYEWVRVETSEGSGVFGLGLVEGPASIGAQIAESGVRLDALLVTDDADFTPVEPTPVQPTATPEVEPTATAVPATATPTVVAPVPTPRVPATPVPTVVAPPEPEIGGGVPVWLWLIIGLLAAALAGTLAFVYFTRWRLG